MTEYIAPTATYVIPADVYEYITPAPAVICLAPTPVVEPRSVLRHSCASGQVRGPAPVWCAAPARIGSPRGCRGPVVAPALVAEDIA